jgi:NAD(P)-dependent dehydrogenase (short-subunit alcohol dehydrogenase family)
MQPASLQLPPVGQTKVWTSLFAKVRHPPASLSLAGQTVLLTGGNQGLGYGCAEWLIELGVFRIILAVRTVSKGEAAAAEFRKKGTQTIIDVWELDMLSFQSVQALAARCQDLDRLDAAILNAGATSFGFERSQHGHEKVFQVNYLSTVLLSMLLLPVLKHKSQPGKPGRLTIVSSGTALIAKFPQREATSILDAMDDEKMYDTVDSYAVTKELGHFWLLKLAQFVKKEDVVVNLVDPGLVKGTQLLRSLPGLMGVIAAGVKSMVARTIRDGASCYIDACFIQGEDSHGSFVMDWRIYA